MRKGVSMAKEESKTIDTFGDYSTFYHGTKSGNAIVTTSSLDLQV